IYQSYTQASAYIEGNYIYNNVEWYMQDNWKVSSKLTLDYGLRFYWIQPQYDSRLQSANFLPNQYDPTQAPRLYYPALANGVRVAQDRLTGETLPAVYIGRLVPNTGKLLNGVVQAGSGIEKGLYQNRGIQYAPRLGFAYDLTGQQRLVIR